MKKFISILSIVMLAACNHAAKDSKTGDSTTINIKTSSPADGGPNNGLGDSISYNRMNDTTVHDSSIKR